ncbi:MAG: hypothetical protein ABSG67_20565 [Thermoguttaceae bacterium]
MKPTVIFSCVIFFYMTAVSLAQHGTGPEKRSLQIAERGSKPDRAKPLGADKAKYEFLNSRNPGQIDRVKVEWKVGGEVIDVVDKKEHREKLSVVCNLDYEEKTLQVPTKAQDLSTSLRYYHQAEAAEKIGEHAFKPVLRHERSLIAVRISSQKPLLFCPGGSLTGEELELVDVQGNSLLMDRFLPDKPVAPGDAWQPSEELMAQLLGLDEVGQTDVKCEFMEITDEVARFEMKGNVSGAADGVTAAIELKARYRYDLKRKRIDWLGMVVRERRQTSPVSDGLDVAAQLQVLIVPAEGTSRLDQSDLTDLALDPTAESTRLSHVSKEGGWELLYDRNWRVYRDQKDLAAAVLRRIEQGEMIAQCNISALEPGEPDKLVSLEKYQEDIQHALGNEFKEFVEAGQAVDKANRRVLRVVVRGTASDLPIVWNYYHIADQQGRQMACVFTFEEKYAQRLGKADREIIDSLRFIGTKQ